MMYICTKFPENISKGYSFIERTRFPYQTFQRSLIASKMEVALSFFISANWRWSYNSLSLQILKRPYSFKNGGGVITLYLCILSDHAVYLF